VTAVVTCVVVTVSDDDAVLPLAMETALNPPATHRARTPAARAA
jgi:hypothetical protein